MELRNKQSPIGFGQVWKASGYIDRQARGGTGMGDDSEPYRFGNRVSGHGIDLV